MSKRGFTLIEVMVAVTVFALVMTTISGILLLVQQGWQRQKTDLDLLQNARWAMDFMISEIRQVRGGISPSGTIHIVIISPDRMWIELDTNGDNVCDTRVWYWRGDAGNYGDSSVIFRGTGVTGVDLDTANTTRQELANFVSNNNIFNLDGNLLTIELTTSKETRTYTLRSQVRPRN